MQRLWGSVFGLLALVSVRPVAANASEDGRPAVELEGAVAVGEGAGATGFGCGHQQTRVRYVVGAAEGRISERPVGHRRGAGATGVFGTAFEYGEQTLANSPQEVPSDTPPMDTGTFATHARFGYHARWFGGELGAGMVSNWPLASAAEGWLVPYLDARLSVGPRDIFHFFAGFGNSQVTAMTAVATPYAGLGWVPSAPLRLEGRFAFETVHAASQLRGDFTAFVRVAPRWSLRGGLGLAHNSNGYAFPWGYEGSVGMLFVR